MFNYYLNTKREYTGVYISIHFSVLLSVFFTRNKMLFVSENLKSYVKMTVKVLVFKYFFKILSVFTNEEFKITKHPKKAFNVNRF